MPLFNSSAWMVTTILSGGCFYKFGYDFNEFGVHDDVCTRSNMHTNFVSTYLLRVGYGTGSCLQCGWDRFILLCPTKQDTKVQRKTRSWVQNSEGVFDSCSCCKYDMHWQVETCECSQISTLKMLWTMVANKLFVVVCKPNGMDDIRCIWELDDEPQCTFQTSKVVGTFNYRQF